MEQLHNGVLRSCAGGWSLSGDPNILLGERKAQRKTRVYYPSYKEEGDTRKYTPTCPSMQNKRRKDKPASTGSGMCGEEENTGQQARRGSVTSRSFCVTLRTTVVFLIAVPQTKPTSYEDSRLGHQHISWRFCLKCPTSSDARRDKHV